MTTAAALATAQATSTLANAQSAAANAVEVMADTLGGVVTTAGVEAAPTSTTGAVEVAVASASAATVASAASLVAAARYFDAAIKTEADAYAAAVTAGGATPTQALADAIAAADLALVNKVKALAATAPTLAATITTFTGAEVKSVATQSLLAKDGTTLSTAAAILARNEVLDGAWSSVNVLAASTTSTAIEAAQQKAAADAIVTLIAADAAAVTTLTTIAADAWPTASFTALNTTLYTKAQYQAAAKAALSSYQGVALTTAADVQARSVELATLANSVNAVSGDFSIAQLNAAAAAALTDANGVTLRTSADDSVAIETRTDALAAAAATAASTAATNVGTAAAADAAAANAVTVALANVTATSIAATQFADATQIWLSGDSSKTNVTGVAATQTIGLDTVTGLDSSVTFGSTVTAGSLAVKGSAGALTVTGATMTSLNISGTGTGATGIALTDGGQAVTTAGVDTVTTLNLSTSGATVLDVTAMTALTSVTQTGAGGVTLTSGSKVASVTTGDGADLVKSVTATVENLINASVTSGAGDDRLVIATTGSGKTVVTAGAGNDTVYLNATGSGANTVSLGDGNDTLRVALGTGVIADLAKTTVDGGAGTDTLRVANTGFTAADYATLTANVTSVETLQLAADVGTSLATGLDASKVAMANFDVRGTGVSYIAEVSSSQTVSVSRTATASAVTGFIDAVTAAVQPDGVSVSAKGYLLDSDAATGGNQTAWGDNLKVNLSGTNASTNTTSVVALGNALALTVAPLATSGTSGASSAVTGVNTVAVVTGDLKGLDVTLSSVRGSGTNGLGVENTGGLTIAMTSTNLQNLASIKVSGAGVATISTSDGTITAAAAKLTTVDLSAMTAFANQNTVGLDLNDSGVYQNMSTSSVTLNNLVSETVILGGARDTIITGSTIAAKDTVTGFQLTAKATDATVVDLTKSDVLKIGVNFDSSLAVGNASYAAKMTTTATSLEGALLEAAGFKVGGVDVNNVVFQYAGNTYVYVDSGNDGLTDADKLVVLSGTMNLDLLLQAGVVIA